MFSYNFKIWIDCRIETLHKAEKCALQQRRNILRERRELQTSYGKRNKDQISEPTWSSKVEECTSCWLNIFYLVQLYELLLII